LGGGGVVRPPVHSPPPSAGGGGGARNGSKPSGLTISSPRVEPGTSCWNDSQHSPGHIAWLSKV
jgi:hypothetical protein